MSCMLRIGGASLDIDALLSQYPFTVNRVWRKGEHRSSTGTVHARSGASVVVSVAEFSEFELQVRDAAIFLQEHGNMVAQAACFPGVENSVLDFAVELQEGYATQYSYLPPPLIQLAAISGIGIEISHYACSNSNEER